MRKHIHIITIIMVLLYLPFSSCKKSFLEIVPKGELVATTYDDYNLLMNSTFFYEYNIGGGWQAAALMGDEVGADEGLFSASSGAPFQQAQSQALFRWNDVVFQSSDYMGNTFISNFLKNIFSCNKIINEVTAVPGGTTQQKLEIQAEAKATRAFIYFQLINYFGKPYAAATASADPGFPVITTADITIHNLSRNSVQEVYDFIIKDMTEAIPNLQATPPVATRMSKPAVEGLLGKVYLSMGRYKDAMDQINASFRDIAAMAVPPHLYNYNVTFASGGSFLPVDPATGPASPFNNETDLTESVVATMFLGGNSPNGFSSEYLVITPETRALYGVSDWRLKFYSNSRQYGGTYVNGMLHKNGVQFIRFGLEMPDLYLLSAECKARLNDLSGAKADVETLRKSRMPLADAPVPAVSATDQTALIRFIIDERIREFAATGYRWFDMRRLSADPLFSGQPAAVHKLYLTAGGTTGFTLRQERLTLRLPPSYIDLNPGMVNNP
jgi:hypothetical protein